MLGVSFEWGFWYIFSDVLPTDLLLYKTIMPNLKVTLWNRNL